MMKTEEFKSFKDEEPEVGKWVVVTNNLEAKNSQGEMSHVWLSNFVQCTEGVFFTFISGSYQRAEHLTHWKYV